MTLTTTARSKGCLGYPKDCVDSRNCEMLTSFEQDPKTSDVMFNLQAQLVHEQGYVAVGLGTDGKMPNASVTFLLPKRNRDWNCHVIEQREACFAGPSRSAPRTERFKVLIRRRDFELFIYQGGRYKDSNGRQPHRHFRPFPLRTICC